MVVSLIVGLLPLFLLFLPVPGSGTNVKGIAEQLAASKSVLLVGVALVATAVMLRLGIKKQKSYKLSLVKKVDSEGPLQHFDGKKQLSIADAVYVGITQFIAAIFPGISRSGSTLSTGLLRSVNKQVALDYSFILGIPAIVAAAVLELKDVLEAGFIASIDAGRSKWLVFLAVPGLLASIIGLGATILASIPVIGAIVAALSGLAAILLGGLGTICGIVLIVILLNQMLFHFHSFN